MQNTTWQEAREAARAVDTRERRAIIRIVAIASLAVIVTVALTVTGILAPSIVHRRFEHRGGRQRDSACRTRYPQ